MTKISLRSNDRFKDFLSESPDQRHLEISGSRLPTREQVLLCFLANYKKVKEVQPPVERPMLEAAKPTVEAILIHYKKARIQAKSARNLEKAVEKLYEELKYSNYYPNNKKSIEFKDNLLKTMPCWPRSCLCEMENNLKKMRVESDMAALKEDIAFFKSMMTDRTATYGGFDKVNRENTRKRARGSSSSSKAADTVSPPNSFAVCNQVEIDSEIVDDNDEEWEAPSAKSRHRRAYKTGLTLHVPPVFSVQLS